MKVTISLALVTVVTAQCVFGRTLDDPIDESTIPALHSVSELPAFEAVLEHEISQCVDLLPDSQIARCEIRKQVWDRELNRIYQLAKSKLSRKAFEQLRVSQILWLKQRDASETVVSTIASETYLDESQNAWDKVAWYMAFDTQSALITRDRVLFISRLLEEM